MQLIKSNSVNMSSQDLLVLVNVARESAGENPIRHSDFYEKCADELDGEDYGISVVKNPNKTETFVIHMSADQCKLVAMRESKAVRRTVLDRLKELESPRAPAFAIPTTLSGALRLAAEQAEQIEQQQVLIEQQRPAVEFVDNYVQSTGLMGFRQVAKLLQANERKFRQILLDKDICYYLGGSLTPKAPHITAGRFEVKTGTNEHNDHTFTQLKFTPKGVEWISDIWRSFGATA